MGFVDPYALAASALYLVIKAGYRRTHKEPAFHADDFVTALQLYVAIVTLRLKLAEAPRLHVPETENRRAL